jgi:hypothetical protein
VVVSGIAFIFREPGLTGKVQIRAKGRAEVRGSDEQSAGFHRS